MNFLKKFHFICKGPKIGEGQVVVTGKKNKEEKTIDGEWEVYKCSNCSKEYAFLKKDSGVDRVGLME